MRVLRGIAVMAALLGLGTTAAADPRLARALEARAAGDWDTAIRESRAAGPLARDIIEWHRLRSSEGTFAEARAFLARNPDWPGLPYLIRQSEETIPRNAPAGEVLGFFEDQAPRTGIGSLRLAAALASSGQRAEAAAEIVRGWTTHSLSQEEEDAFLQRHGNVIVGHHWERADMLMWRGLTGQAERLLPRLSDEQRALARARIALREGDDGVNALIDAVPRTRAGDPGLAYERFRWRANRGRTDGAIELMEAQRQLGRPESWANLRRRYARQLMRAESNRRAYNLAAAHGLNEGQDFADLEWLAGYIALRKLDRPDVALRHFEAFETAIFTPISLARAGYWQARAHRALGQTQAAAEDYARAAEHQTAFYGLLAAEEAGLPRDPALAGTETFPDWRSAPFTQSSVFQAAGLLLAAGDLNLGERFLTHLAESLDRTETGQLMDYARSLGIPHLEVMIGKRAVRYGHTIEGPYYALHPLAQNTGDVPPELALAIARRESEFDPVVISGAGARGLMQVMPATAAEVARDLGVTYSERRLITDPDYNASLGVTYLAQLIEQFGNSPVLVAAAYNAGPSRAVSWSNRRGDPRSGRLDLIDWIEHIPFRETRNYVMRVTESLPIYRARLSGRVDSKPFMDDLQGAYPSGRAYRGTRPASAAPEISLRPQPRPAALATR